MEPNSSLQFTHCFPFRFPLVTPAARPCIVHRACPAIQSRGSVLISGPARGTRIGRAREVEEHTSRSKRRLLCCILICVLSCTALQQPHQFLLRPLCHPFNQRSCFYNSHA